MRASVVIASHNEGELLWKTVRSCLDTTEGLDCEVIVADDASDDNSLELLRRHCDGAARIVRFDTREGVSRTKDLGARAAGARCSCSLTRTSSPSPGLSRTGRGCRAVRRQGFDLTADRDARR